MKRGALLVALALAGAGGLVFAARSLGAAQTDASPPQPTLASWLSPAGDPVRGKALSEPCLVCHSETSPVTDPVSPRLDRQRQSYMFHALLAYRDGGRESAIMEPMVEGKSDQDLRDIAAYVSGELHDRPPEPMTDSEAYRRSLKDCTWCHGETGIGEFEGMPVLAGQDAAYIAQALAEYRSGVRDDPTMRKVAEKLSPEDARAFGEYYAQYEWLEKLK